MKAVATTILILILLGLPTRADDEAQRLYDNQHYEDAIRRYDRIISEHPEWEEAHFGRGAALYKLDQIDEAMREFEQAIPSKDPRQKSAAFYNLGNALLKSQRLEESLRFYRRALELNPRDYDAKHNFELARQMLQEQQQEQPQQSQNPDPQNQESQQNQPGQPNQPPEQAQEQRQKQEFQPQQKPRQQKQEQEKSREEAAQVLDALKDTEKKMMQERMKTKYSGMKKEKDW